jgi:hypothetical protein
MGPRLDMLCLVVMMLKSCCGILEGMQNIYIAQIIIPKSLYLQFYVSCSPIKKKGFGRDLQGIRIGFAMVL